MCINWVGGLALLAVSAFLLNVVLGSTTGEHQRTIYSPSRLCQTDSEIVNAIFDSLSIQAFLPYLHYINVFIVTFTNSLLFFKFCDVSLEKLKVIDNLLKWFLCLRIAFSTIIFFIAFIFINVPQTLALYFFHSPCFDWNIYHIALRVVLHILEIIVVWTTGVLCKNHWFENGVYNYWSEHASILWFFSWVLETSLGRAIAFRYQQWAMRSLANQLILRGQALENLYEFEEQSLGIRRYMEANGLQFRSSSQWDALSFTCEEKNIRRARRTYSE